MFLIFRLLGSVISRCIRGSGFKALKVEVCLRHSGPDDVCGGCYRATENLYLSAENFGFISGLYLSWLLRRRKIGGIA